MKRTLILLSVLFFLSSCSSFETKKSNTISGSTDIPMNKKGVTFSPGIHLSGTFYNGTAEATITKVKEDITTIRIKATLPPNMPVLDAIKSKYKDDSGNLDCEATFKFTTDGILDFNNADGEPFVLVKWDAKVGDKYRCEKSDGTVMTREVVRKSKDDDYIWNGMSIKTIDVEQDSRIPGVEKIVYFTNHKFGIVGIRVVQEDDSFGQVDLYPSDY